MRSGSGEAQGLGALQRAFAGALIEKDAAPPHAIAATSEAQRLKRFNVYRNNVHASLAAAVAARFPVVERLTGREFFRAMALVFVERSPPASPILAFYGAEFPLFLESFEPVRALPYLSDVARLEWLRAVAYHAPDAQACTLAELAALPEERLAEVVVELHPAAGWIASAYPIVSIWRTNTHDADVVPIGMAAAGEDALVTRPALDVLVTLLPPGGAAVLSALSGGGTLGEAMEDALQATPDLDVATILAALFNSGAIVRASMKSSVSP